MLCQAVKFDMAELSLSVFDTTERHINGREGRREGGRGERGRGVERQRNKLVIQNGRRLSSSYSHAECVMAVELQGGGNRRKVIHECAFSVQCPGRISPVTYIIFYLGNCKSGGVDG